MKLLRRKRTWFLLLFPLSLLLAHLARMYPRAVESLYSNGLYRFLSAGLGRLFSLVPFSTAEILLLVLAAGGLAGITLLLSLLIRKRAGRPFWLSFVLTAAAAASAVYFLFILFCGLNYHRVEFAVHSGLDVRDSTVQELAALCADLVEDANRLRRQVPEDDGVMALSHSFSRLAAMGPEAYDRLGQRYAVLGGYTPRAKPVMLSRGMSWLHISGIYVPFTFEANVNTDTPAYSIPSSLMHELAHFKGFMREDEANFISYLACLSSEDPEIAYSGVMLALVHTQNALYAADRDLYGQVLSALDESVVKDFSAGSLYWRQFEGPAAQVSTAVNNAYLKSNSQQSGVKSYGRMVDLLLAEHRQRADS